MSINITFAVTNPLHLEGVEHARGLYNASLPPIPATEEGGEPTPNPGLSAEQYLTFIAFSAVGSWSIAKVRADWEAGNITVAQRDEAIAAIAAIVP